MRGGGMRRSADLRRAAREARCGGRHADPVEARRLGRWLARRGSPQPVPRCRGGNRSLRRSTMSTGRAVPANAGAAGPRGHCDCSDGARAGRRPRGRGAAAARRVMPRAGRSTSYRTSSSCAAAAGRDRARSASSASGGRRVVTLLGFITERKGHRLLLEALPLLPHDVSVLIAGSPITGRDFRGASSRNWHRDEDRTASSSPATSATRCCDRVLAATDVAACPFRDVSASGSLSTWISAGTRVVASDLPALARVRPRSCPAPSVASRRAEGGAGRRAQRRAG